MILLITFCVVIIIQLYFYLFLFQKYASHKSLKNNSSEIGVSVVIAAKNEEINLSNLLQILAQQEFSLFEVILVDDNSQDATLSKMNAFKELHQLSHFEIKVISISLQDSLGKKQAVTKGINAARYENILLTDADCQPNSIHWISHMLYSFSDETALVLGYGAYKKINHSILNKLIRFETLLTAVQYFSYALDGRAYMGVGRNLAYKKSIFHESGGFKKHEHLRSGDDDLFVSQVANSTNVALCDHPESFTISIPHEKFSSWIRQKRRHITTAAHYKKSVKISLALFFLSQFLFYALAITALISKAHLEYILPLIFLRFLAWHTTLYVSAKKLEEKDLLAFGPLYEISIIFIQLYIFFKNLISPPKYW